MKPLIPMQEVSTLLRAVAEALILPRFRALKGTEIDEKGPGDLVTVVDREVEKRLVDVLPTLISGSRVIGEEGVAVAPDLLTGLDRGWVWIVDPLDGTGNFVEGREDFATMVGLLRDGEAVAGWIHAPVTGRLWSAEAGAGAELDGVRLSMPSTSPEARKMASVRYLPAPLHARWRADPRAAEFDPGSRSAGCDYPTLIAGGWRSLFYWRTHPWDHLPGSLIVEEAGGVVARLDGTRYRAGDGRSGLVVAGSPADWQDTHRRLPVRDEVPEPNTAETRVP